MGISEDENLVSLVFRDHQDSEILNWRAIQKTTDADVLATTQILDFAFYIGTSRQVRCDGIIVRTVVPGCKRFTVTAIEVRSWMITTVKVIRGACRPRSPRRNPNRVRHLVKKRKLLKSTYEVQRQDAYPQQSALQERQRIPPCRHAWP